MTEGQKVKRPFRVVYTKGWSRGGMYPLPKPRVAATYTTREKAEAEAGSRWGREYGARVEVRP